MGNCFMDSMDKYVDEKPIVLFKKAEKNIAGIIGLLNDKSVPEDTHYENICFNATQAVEKYLKGYVIDNNEKVKKIHNLDTINEITCNINVKFKEIKEECAKLNNYTADIRYSDKHEIEKHEVIDILKCLNKIYNFEPIISMREKFKKQDGFSVYNNYEFLERYKFKKKERK